MALNPEFGKTPKVLPHINLRSEATLKKLMEDGRYPALSRLGYKDTKIECFIPGNDTAPSQSFKISFEEAREIIAIRTRLEKASNA